MTGGSLRPGRSPIGCDQDEEQGGISGYAAFKVEIQDFQHFAQVVVDRRGALYLSE